ncbi:DNA mismatch repair protein MutT [Bacterioplanes sanyensis]|uniref:DNA mismatch repair protein MutT n=1 Tax=Bacterioplanes sanyensis TaxID=1249553 RepID=A0A222FFE5_9GAMM|nr:NUDIX domain-containing protein [Bacterioplanes sanyensis]ASP37805.1 DNA mismatch repair protein MutT [Bacterioplanes sanyensis]
MKPRACALILNESQQILLIHRIKNDREYWVFPGGGIEAGETAEQAVIREVKEETSLIAKSVALVFEQFNADRKESYFSVDIASGKVELGNGPEKLKQSRSNFYAPQWVDVAKLKAINLQPEAAAEKLQKLLPQGGLKVTKI